MKRTEHEKAVNLIRGHLSSQELLNTVELLDWGPLEFIGKWRLRRIILAGRLPKCGDMAPVVELGGIVRRTSHGADADMVKQRVSAYCALIYLAFGLCDSQEFDLQYVSNAFRLVVSASGDLSVVERNALLDAILKLSLSDNDDVAYFAVLSLFLLGADMSEDRFQSMLTRLQLFGAFEETIEADELAQWRDLASEQAGVIAQPGAFNKLLIEFPWLKRG